MSISHNTPVSSSTKASSVPSGENDATATPNSLTSNSRGSPVVRLNINGTLTTRPLETKREEVTSTSSPRGCHARPDTLRISKPWSELGSSALKMKVFALFCGPTSVYINHSASGDQYGRMF